MAPEKDSEKVTVMILYVDLKCSCCYKKVRKLLCKYPQIRDQVFDEANNKVTITVVCCDPERFRDKLCCKGGRAIQSIEIVENKPPPPPKQPSPAPAPKPVVVVDKPKDPPPPKLAKPPPPVVVEAPKPQLEKKPSGKPKPPTPAVIPVPEKPKPADPPKPTPMPPPVVVQQPQPKPQPVKMPDPIPQPQPVKMPDPMPMPMPMDGYHPQQPFCPPVSTCCQECYEGRDGGPCHYGYGRPAPPPPCYDYYGYQYPSNRPCYVTRCDYFSEDNPQGCSIM